MTELANEPLDLFYSYSHRDEELRDELAKHLSLLERRRIIRSWHDRKILGGETWAGEIDENLARADIVLLLVSSDFIASNYCYEKEMKLALERHAQGASRSVPVIVRPCDWHDAEFGSLQVLPKDGKAVTSWAMRDEAWTDVAKGIRRLASELGPRERPPEAPPAPAPPVRTRGGGRATRGVPRHEPAEGALHVGVLDDFVRRVALARPSAPRTDSAQLRRLADRLAALRDWRRILWVDDHPENNLHLRQALLGMQIEVVTALTTDDALGRLRQEPAGFHLVISDWERAPRKDASLPEGLRLAVETRRVHAAPPVVFYYGAVDVDRREAEARRTLVIEAGALSATASPVELMRLIVAALE